MRSEVKKLCWTLIWRRCMKLPQVTSIKPLNETSHDFLQDTSLNKDEFNLIFQNGISSWGGTRKMPYAFTEQGVAMLSGVLKSPRAIEVSINIMDAFVHMRQYLLSHAPKQELEELRKRIEYLEEDISSDRESYEKQFDDLFTAFAKLSAAIQIKQTPLDRVKIEGFKNK